MYCTFFLPSICYKLIQASWSRFLYTQAFNLPALSYSFNLEEYFDEDEISLSATSSKETLPEETKNQLRDVLPIFEKNIADLVQDTDPMHRVFLAIKGNPSPALSRVLSPFSIFEDQVLKVKQAQRNLFDRETLLAKGNSNRQEAKELT